MQICAGRNDAEGLRIWAASLRYRISCLLQSSRQRSHPSLAEAEQTQSVGRGLVCLVANSRKNEAGECFAFARQGTLLSSAAVLRGAAGFQRSTGLRAAATSSSRR